MALAEVTIPFTLGPGTANTRTELPPLDLSRARWIRMELVLTTADTDAGDTLDIYLQEASDDATPTWDDRAHFVQFIGTLSPTAAAPEKYIIQFPGYGFLPTVTDESYEGSGSAGGTRVAAGAFITGPLRGKRRDPVSGARAASHRISFELVDADADASFIGVLHFWYETGV